MILKTHCKTNNGNPYTYTVFFVIAEPVDDPDPRPSDVVVGSKLPIPFGQ